MNELLATFVAIIGVFAVGLVVKAKWLRRICVICVSVSITWLALLGLYKLGLFANTVLLAILMGESVTGLFYLVEKRVRRELLVFRLPFLLTLTILAYSAISFTPALLPVYWLLLGLWLLARLVFASNLDPGKPSLANRIINCCGGVR